VAYLAALLDTRRFSEVVRFVEFSNQVYSGQGTRRPVQGKTFLSRIYWIRAIQMAEKGYNDLTNVGDELAVSFGYRDEDHMIWSYLQPSLNLGLT
jgi:hypothetical protein